MMLTKEQLDKLRGVVSGTSEKSTNKPLQTEVVDKRSVNTSGSVFDNLNPKWKNLVERYENSAGMQYSENTAQYDEFGVVITNDMTEETSVLPKISEFGIAE